MLRGTFTESIQAPPEKVWALVADLGTHASWSPKDYSMKWVDGEPNEIGSTLHSIGWVPGKKNNENDVKITERLEPTRFAFQAQDPQGVFVNEWDMQPVGEGATQVTFTLTFPKLHGAAAVMAPILFPLVGKPDLRKRMTLLKQAAESHG